MPRWAWALTWVGVATVAALTHGWASGNALLETYYAGADRAMATSWHAWLFGAADPAATITMDKLPGAFWLQALSVRAFGAQVWAVVLPQVVEGVLAVLVLGRAVARLAGPGPAVIAAAVLAVSPAAVALAHGNVADSLMVLLVVLAADATSAAVRSGSTGRVLLAGAWVGLAFQAKMLAAWLVLPALAVALVVAAPGRLRRRILQAVAGGAVALMVSLAWIAAVGLVPAAGRPAVDGSARDSLWDMVFVYNGFGRLSSGGPLATLAQQFPGLLPTVSAPSPLRLFTGSPGLMAGWLLLPALVAAVAVLVARRRAPRTDRHRAAALLWGTWLVTFGAAFSVIGGLQAYYTAALGPAVAALLGLGAGLAGEHRAARGGRLGAALTAAATAAVAIATLATRPDAAPAWLVPAVAVLAVAGIALAWGRRAVPVAAAAAGAAALLAPTVGAVGMAAAAFGPFDTPFPSTEQRDERTATLARAFVQTNDELPGLQELRGGTPWLAAVQNGLGAGDLIWRTGDEVLPVGGVTGTQPYPTVNELAADVAAGRFRTAIVIDPADPRFRWVAAHCQGGTGQSTIKIFTCGS